jgi:hypothetical protein
MVWHNFSRTSIPDKATGFMDHLMEEAVEIRLHPRNFKLG